MDLMGTVGSNVRVKGGVEAVNQRGQCAIGALACGLETVELPMSLMTLHT